MKQSLIALIALRKLVSEMEKDLGMNELSEVERLILLAANELQDTNGEVDSVALREPTDCGPDPPHLLSGGKETGR